ncbi:MAG: Fe-S-binding domain-containing protein, partial [Acidobacteriota bacterium]
MNLLDIVLFLPLIGFFVILAMPKEISRMTAMLLSVAIFLLSLGLLSPFASASPAGYQFITDISWIQSPSIRYHVGMDGLSLWLVLLSTLLTPIAILISWKYIDHRVKEYFA